jgi:nucleoside-diphosphate kinase
MLEQTFVMLKPDTIQRSLIGELMQRIERTGLKLVALKMLRATEAQLTAHYGKDDAWYLEKGTKRAKLLAEAGKPVDKEPIEYGKDIVRGLIKFMTVSPMVAMVWEGNQAVGVVKKLVGATEPLTSDVGTIRGDFTIDSYGLSDTDQRAIRNLVHCSDQPAEAQREIAVWFKPDELHQYRHIAEEILYDINLDGIRE